MKTIETDLAEFKSLAEQISKIKTPNDYFDAEKAVNHGYCSNKIACEDWNTLLMLMKPYRRWANRNYRDTAV